MGIFDKVNESQIVGKTPSVNSKDPDLQVFLNPSKVIVRNGGNIVYQYGLENAYVGDFIASAGIIKDLTKGAVTEEPETERPDIPDLTDITLYKSEKYWDSAKKQERARLVIKVMNNSKFKEDVVGIDAKRYNPEETK